MGLGSLLLIFLTTSSFSPYKAKRQPQVEPAPNTIQWELSQSLLYWKAHENRLQYTDTPSTIATTTDFTTTSRVSPHFKWHFGGRETLSYFPRPTSFCHDWDFALEWTYIINKAQGRRSAEPADGMSPLRSLLPDADPADFVSKAQAHWNVHLNVAEARATYNYQPLKWFSFSPYLGIKSIWIHQLFKIQYQGGTLISGPENIKMRNNCFGIGPEIGIKPVFILSKEWSLFSTFAYAPMAGYFRVKQKDTYTPLDSLQDSHSFWKYAPAMDMSAGFGWKICLFKSRFSIGLRATWEYHIFFSQNHLKSGSLYHLKGNKNLTFQGATFSVDLGF
ncbi:MAG: hypothetical protein JSR58_02500 [Verrucomicrobia bacterium]|nr:hypothetical protein [Verrucomicrobiota bacterium]